MTQFKHLAIALAVSTLMAGPVAAAMADGTYTGVGQGKNGDVTVELQVTGGKLAAVRVVKHVETPGISDAAMTQFPQRVVDAQSLNVDAVSGATLTSDGIRNAVADAIRKAGGDPAAFAAVTVKKNVAAKLIKDQADVIVVGAGGSGISAAVRAETLGANVILIEKMPVIGGATALNAGTLIATGSRFQKESLKETKDSPELAAKDIFRVGKNRNDPVLVKQVTERVGGVVDWLVYDLKIPYGPAATQYPDHSANRQLGVTGRSVNFLKLMREKFEHMGGKLMLETRAQELLRDKDGRVVGVRATDAAGNTVELTSKAVILASGGYGAVKSMLPKEMNQYVFYGLDSETGDGFKMATAIGADTINMDLVKMYPQGVETVPGHGLAATASSTDTMKKSGAIYVNRDGQRYVNELASLGELTDTTVAQPGHIAYIVMDKKAWKEYVNKSLEDRLVPDEATLMKWTKIVNNGRPVMAVADDLKKAAEVMGVNPDGLTKTVKEWNDMVAAGKDTKFGRKIVGGLGEGPFYIVEQKVRYQTTLGGLRAGEGMRILDKNGKPIEGLYGAGCVVGGANGADSMTAMMNSWAIVSGVIAAETAVGK
ncbi:MAG: FAD-dependent oxidoreductase [Sutterella wadsworthensis]|nr:FAD-dependent oxidoreductase [Sutterella wadsworthensis]